MTINLENPQILKLPEHLSLEKGELVASSGGWFSSEEEVTDYFLNFVKRKIAREESFQPETLRLVDEYLKRKGIEKTEKLPQNLAALERYALAAHLRTKDLDATQITQRKQKIQEHDSEELYKRWVECHVEVNGASTLFYLEPDLVDQVFQTHLHRILRHPAYDHHIYRGKADSRASLFENGKLTPWVDLKKRFVCKGSDFYEKDVLIGYFHQGFSVQRVANCFNQLKTPPDKSCIELVIAQRCGWDPLNPACGQGEHTFCRLIFGKDAPEHAGKVYIFGFLGSPSFTLLNTIPSRFFCPDPYEFTRSPSTFKVGTTQVPKEHALSLLKELQTLQAPGFNALHDNCHALLLDLLHRHGIVPELQSQEPLRRIVCRTLLPEWVLKTVDKIVSFVPQKIQDLCCFIVDFLTALVFHSLVGAWFKSASAQTPVFTHFCDLWNPKKTYLSTAYAINAWIDRHSSGY